MITSDFSTIFWDDRWTFWKLLKDYEETEGFIVKTPREAIKQAFQSGYTFISNGHDFDALQDRNLTAHIYNALWGDIMRRYYEAILWGDIMRRYYEAIAEPKLKEHIDHVGISIYTLLIF